MKTLLLTITLCLSLILDSNCNPVTFNNPFSIPAGDYQITPNANGTFTVSLTQSGWVSSDVFANQQDNSSFYVVITSATAEASAGIILLQTVGDTSDFYNCMSNDGYNNQASLVSIPRYAPDTASCGVADIATIYYPVKDPISTSSINANAALNVPQNFQYNYYQNSNPNAMCIEVVVGAETVNQGGICDDLNFDDDLQFMNQYYGLYLEVEAPGTATFLVGNGFLCQANCSNCTNYNTCTACNAGYTLNGTQCIPTPTKPVPKCHPSCPKCDTTQTVMSGGNQYYACARCPSGQYVNPDKYECSNCQANCASCCNGNQCQICNFGYVLSGGNCVKPTCSPTCAFCNFLAVVPKTGNYACAICPRGSYLKPNLYECQSCPSTCTSCLSSSLCLSCTRGYILYNFQCIKAKSLPWH